VVADCQADTLEHRDDSGRHPIGASPQQFDQSTPVTISSSRFDG